MPQNHNSRNKKS